MNVPITFPKSNNILLAVRIGQLGAEFLSDVNLRHSLKRTLLRSGDDDTLLLIYVSGTPLLRNGKPDPDVSDEGEILSCQTTELTKYYSAGCSTSPSPVPYSSSLDKLTRTRKAVLVVKQICLYLISSDKVSSERRGKGEV